MSEFEASPRQSKRRRTGTYSSRRTTLSTAIESPLPDSDNNEPESGPAIEKSSDKDALTRLEQEGKLHSTVEFHSKTRERRSVGKRTSIPRNIQHDPDIDEPPAPTASKEDTEQTPFASNPTTNDDNTELQTRSSGRARRPPKRFLAEVDTTATPSTTVKASVRGRASSQRPVLDVSNSPVASPQPKGILTPSRKERGTRSRKSVVFDGDEKRIEEQLGFKDIDVSAKKTRNKTASTPRSVPSKRSTDLDYEVEAHSDEETRNENELDSIVNDAPDLGDVQSFAADSTDLLRKQLFTDDAVDEEPVAKIKLQVLERLTSTSLTPITHLEKEYNALHSLLTATVSAGESNSLLLLGSRGSGKSLLIEHALHDLERQFSGDFHVVRLNGFVQTDDKVALREIWRQLGREMAVSEDETGQVSSYADTMASLLTLLSHADDLDDPDAMMVDSPDDTVGKTAKSVIFIMDEFDLFTTHPRQTLLYNLFDIAQAKKAPIAVIGCSTRTDVVDLLEKRVKSRFSHRWLHVPAIKTLVGFEEALVGSICLPVDGKEAIKISGDDLEWRDRWNKFIKVCFVYLVYEQLLTVWHSLASFRPQWCNHCSKRPSTAHDACRTYYLSCMSLWQPCSSHEKGMALAIISTRATTRSCLHHRL